MARRLALTLAAAALIAGSLGAARPMPDAARPAMTPPSPAANAKPIAPPAMSTPAPASKVAPLDCGLPAPGAASTAAGDPKLRRAAQKGLEFLGRETVAWAKAQQCFGCHVQSQTVQAMAYGLHHQYDVPTKDLREIVSGMLTLSGGGRTKAGFSYHETQLLAPAKAFGGVALARYDQWIDSAARDELVRTARQLVEFQRKDGSVALDYVNGPVSTGDLQGTYQAMQTWAQVYARTADDAWRAPLRKAETWVQSLVKGWNVASRSDVQELDYALLALVASGSSRTEASTGALVKRLLAVQNQDGGWGLTAGAATSAFATGQALYALRQAGLTEQDSAISRGTARLVAMQQANGGWGASGSGKAEAMWAILGLVSIDVLSVSFRGIEEGGHVNDDQAIGVDATDNKGRGVKKIELFVDDVALTAACGPSLSYVWNTRALAPGLHVVDAIATNASGEQSRRRIEVYSGDTFLTQVGSRFADGGTVFTLRNVAPPEVKGTVTLTVRQAKTDGGVPAPGETVATLEQPATQGAMSFFWDGRAAGKAQPHGRYFAELAFTDASGRARQRESTLFFHDTPERQRRAQAEVEGRLDLDKGGGAANTKVELVDGEGRVVAVTTSTASGEYRFKNVDEGKYKVRVQKRGFLASEADVDAKKDAAPAAAPPMQLNAESP